MDLTEEIFSKEWRSLKKKLEGKLPVTLEEHRLVGSFNNVQRRRAEAQLRASEARLNALMDASEDAILLIQGRSGHVLRANNAAHVLFGYTPKQMLQEPMEVLVGDELRAKHVVLRSGFLRSIRKREMGFHPPIFGLTKDGREIELEIALTATEATDDVMVICRLVGDDRPRSPSFESSESGQTRLL